MTTYKYALHESKNEDDKIRGAEGEDVDKIPLGDELSFIRRILGYSQQNLADILGVTKNAISIYETKRDDVSMVMALKIHFILCEILGDPHKYGLRESQSKVLQESKYVFYKHCASQLIIGWQ